MSLWRSGCRVVVVLWVSCRGGGPVTVSFCCCPFTSNRKGYRSVGRMEIPRQPQYPHMMINVLHDSACERRVIVTLFIHYSSVFNICFRLNPSLAFLFLVVQTPCPWFKFSWKEQTSRPWFTGEGQASRIVVGEVQTLAKCLTERGGERTDQRGRCGGKERRGKAS